MDLLTEMRIPTRAAPKPPGRIDANHLSVPKNPNVWGSSNDLFGSSSVQVPQKKKPPPRPPPPKFPPKYSQVQNQEKPKKPARPTELLSNLFGRRTSNSHKQQQHHHQQQQQYSSRTTSSSSSSGGGFSSTSFANFGSTTATTTTFQPACTSRSSEPSVSCLIDLSPPGSPTFTTRSSSDGVSVDSFGSDGNSNPSAFASSSSGSTSQTESAFEDDFDFFAGLAAAAGRKQNQPADPWRVSCSQDPFGSLEQPPSAKPLAHQWPSSTQQYSQIKEVGESNFFAFNDASTTTSSSASGSPFDSPSKPPFKMPTIIWGRKPNQRKDSGGGGGSSSNSNNSSPKISVYQSSASSNNYGGAPRFAPATKLPEQTQTKLEKSPWGDEDVITSTPPIPDQPPPEYIAGLEDGLVENSERPYGIALYDFPASQPGDLELKEGDVVYLTKLINDNWMEGRVDSREGIFPVNFVDVKIALPGVETNVVNALYAFKAETSDDLSFEEGARIKVLSRISDDWLYGEYNGQRGQFPANFVDKVPNDLPNHL